MKIGIIGALAIETEGLSARLTNTKTECFRGVTFVSGELYAHELIIVTCGVGKVFSALAATLLIDRYEPDALINIGVAGGAKPLRQGDIVISKSAVQHDYDATADQLPPGQLHGFDSPFIACDGALTEKLLAAAVSLGFSASSGVIVSGDQFINDREKAGRLVADFGAAAFDMESAAIAQVACVLRVPFTALRSVSDNGDDEAVDSFYAFVEKAAARCIATIEQFCKSMT